MEEDWVDVEMSDKNDLPIRSVKSSKSSDVSVHFYNIIAQRALRRLEDSKSPIFHVDLGDKSLYSTFIENLQSSLHKEYDCHACRHFATRYGDLALVKEDGILEPLLWSRLDIAENANVDKIFGNAVFATAQRFDSATVTREFKVIEKKKKKNTESAVDGGFTHLHIDFPASRVRKQEPKGFASANTPELADMLKRVLADYNLDTIRKVNEMLVENKLPYADAHKASIKWLLELVEQDRMGKARGPAHQHNLLYRYAASSFIGSLKQMRSGALWTLLENVKGDKSWESILHQWRMICDPTQYMRPQAAPSAGNIAAAEKLFEQLGLTKDDLKRRLLVQDEVPENVVIWASQAMKDKPKETPETTNKVFGAVKPKDKFNAARKVFDAVEPASQLELPAAKISFTKFVNKVLRTAKKVECWLGSYDQIVTFITGLEGSKPLLQWHNEDNNSLASPYLWTYPPHVSKHNLRPNQWNEVRCLIPFPSLWDGAPLTTTFPLVDPDGEEATQYKYYHKKLGFRYLFVLEENHESELKFTPLFPSFMKSEFHGVRSTIEAFTRTENLLDVKDGMARGGFVGGVQAARSSSNQELRMRVTKNNGELSEYRITLFE